MTTICRIYTPNAREVAHFILEEMNCSQITVGRSANCVVPIPTNDMVLSRVHFTLKLASDGWQLVDSSKAGTFKNGEKVKTCTLRSGDVFRFGQFFFCFGEKAIPSEYSITWMDEAYHIRRAAAIWPGVNGIGASSENEIFIKNEALARFQGIIFYKQGKLTYRNKNSLVSSKINGEVVQDEMPLSEGDELQYNGFVAKVTKTVRHIVPVIKNSGTTKGYAYKFRKHLTADWMTVAMWGGGIILLALLTLLVVFMCLI